MLMLLAAAATAALRLHATLDGTSTGPQAVSEQAVSYGDGCARVERLGELTYAAGEALSLDQGTVSFWWKPGAGALDALSVSHAGRRDRFLTVGARSGGDTTSHRIGLAIRDRSLADRLTVAADAEPPAAGRWRHIAVTWTELSGAALYVDGRRHAAVPGPIYFNARAGILRLHGPAEFDELRVYSGALDGDGVATLARRQEPRHLPLLSPPPPLAGRFGWHAVANVPSAGAAPLRITRVEVTDARAIKRAEWSLTDGQDETVWPWPEPEGRYRDEAGAFTITPAEREPVNIVRSVGTARVQIGIGEWHYPRPGDVKYLHYARLRPAVTLEELPVSVHEGTLAAVELYRMEPVATAAGAAAQDKGGEALVAMPAKEDVAVGGVRVTIEETKVGAYYRVAVRDPVEAAARYAIEFDVRAGASRLTLEFRFPPYLVRAGSSMRVEAWSSEPGRERVSPASVAWLRADQAAARRAHLDRRRHELRDLYRRWTATGGRPTGAQALGEDVLYWQRDGDDRLAKLLAEGRLSSEAAAGDWAAQQRAAVRHLRSVVDWWIDHRQAESGEFGNGPEADADMLEMIVAAARMDGRVERYRRAARKLFDWMSQEHWGEAVLPRVAAAAWALDPGNPTLARTQKADRRERVPARPYGTEQGLETIDEPAIVRALAASVRMERLGDGDAVTWENTGGQVAARVIESTGERLRAEVIAVDVGRRVLMRVWRLVHGEYELRFAGETRALRLKPGSPVELDVPAGPRPAELALELRSRRVPIELLPDLAVAPERIAAGKGRALVVTVDNLGAIPAPGPIRVAVYAAGGDADRALAETTLGRIDAGGAAEARLAGVTPAAGMRVRVETRGDEIFDLNNEAVLDEAAVKRLAALLLRP